MPKNCADCKNCVMVDYGFSDWTVEGTDLICAKGAHPKMPFDRWYNENTLVTFAENCSEYVESDNVIHINVEFDRNSGWWSEDELALYDAACKHYY